MYNELLKFFALHHQLALPGIGSFTVETKAAVIDFTSRQINASKTVIVFNNEAVQPAKAFYDFLSAELNANHEKAVAVFADFTGKLKAELNSDKPVYFKGIGSLIKKAPGEFLFEAAPKPEWFPELAAEKVIRKNTIHTIMVGEEEKTSDEMQAVLAQTATGKKDKWWIAAAVLGAVGIAAIVVYYTFLA